MAGKYQSLNVLNRRSVLMELEDQNAVNQVQAMVNGAGNRADRRKILKSLHKTATITAHADKRASERANRELANKAELDMVWMYAMTGIVLYEDYRWREDPTQDHGQLTSFFDRLTKKMNHYNEMGYSVEDVARVFEEKTGICLVPEKH